MHVKGSTTSKAAAAIYRKMSPWVRAQIAKNPGGGRLWFAQWCEREAVPGAYNYKKELRFLLRTDIEAAAWAAWDRVLLEGVSNAR